MSADPDPTAAHAALSLPHTKAGRVQRAVLDLLREHEAAGDLPTSGRFVFYELEQRGDATKPDPADLRPNKRRSHGWPPGEQDVIDALKALRDRGQIPWDWIVDETRRLSTWAHAPTVLEYLADRVREATLSPWGDEVPPLILCESRATAGVLEAAASGYVCPIAGTAGHVGGFLHTEVVARLPDTERVRYLGDLDRHGRDIEANTRRVLEAAWGRELDWERLAMTEQQAKAIPPIWKVDGRDKAGDWAWEVESLGQGGVVSLVREGLDAMLAEPLAVVQERERGEQADAAALIERWRSDHAG